MPRRAVIAPLVATALALVAIAVQALQLHAASGWWYRDSLAMFTETQNRNVKLGTDPLSSTLAAPPPTPWQALLDAIPTGLMVLSVALLSIALAWAGYRLWGALVPLILNTLAALRGWPLVDLRVLPGGTPEPFAGSPAVSSSTWEAWMLGGPGFPWVDALLLALLMTIPVLVALGSVRASAQPFDATAVSTDRSTRTSAIRPEAVAAVVVAWLLLQRGLSSLFGIDLPLTLSEAGTAVVVITSTGLLARALPRGWAAGAGLVAVAVVGLDAVEKSGIRSGSVLHFDTSAIVFALVVVTLGPAAVLLGPGLGRWWVATFRRTPNPAPVDPERLAP